MAYYNKLSLSSICFIFLMPFKLTLSEEHFFLLIYLLLCVLLILNCSKLFLKIFVFERDNVLSSIYS